MLQACIFTNWHLFYLLSNSKSSSEFYVYIINAKPMKPSIRYYIPISHFSKQFSHILLASKFLPSLRVIHNSRYKFTSWHLFHLFSNSKSSSEFYVYIINVKPSIRYYISISTVLQTVFTFFSSPKILQNSLSVSSTILDTNLQVDIFSISFQIPKALANSTST